MVQSYLTEFVKTHVILNPGALTVGGELQFVFFFLRDPGDPGDLGDPRMRSFLNVLSVENDGCALGRRSRLMFFQLLEGCMRRNDKVSDILFKHAFQK